MNIVLFETDEIGKPFSRTDERIKHVLQVLGRSVGESFDAGEINGRSGKAVLTKVGDELVELELDLNRAEPPLPPIDLIVGLSRPQTNRKVLQEGTAIGVRSLSFVLTERGESSYASSKLWTTGEWRRHLVAGAAQAFSTRIPEVSFGTSLETAVNQLDPRSGRIVLDNYVAKEHLAALEFQGESVAVAIGSERGWTDSERRLLGDARFSLAHLGERPLRTETATIAALVILNYNCR